jgi:branched-chain amino acid aminotransferase
MGELKVYLNGAFVPENAAVVSVYDHGLLYGDGVFEGIRAYDGRVFKLHEHVARLYQSAKAIALEIPLAREAFAEVILEACRVNDLRDAYLRPVVTRGPGDLGIDPRRCKAPTVIVIARPVLRLYGADGYAGGLRVVSLSTRRNPPDALNPNIKSLNYLNNILGRLEANRQGADEGLFLDLRGFVSEATADNVFIVSEGCVLTPPVYNSLRGLTRAAVLEIAAELRVPIREAPLTLFDVYNADEVFITGTAAEIAPVIDVDGRTIGDGRPGAVTQRLWEAFPAFVRRTGVAIYTEPVEA